MFGDRAVPVISNKIKKIDDKINYIRAWSDGYHSTVPGDTLIPTGVVDTHGVVGTYLIWVVAIQGVVDIHNGGMVEMLYIKIDMLHMVQLLIKKNMVM